MREKTEHIIGYLEKRLSPEERKAFEEEINTSPELKKETEDFAFILKASEEFPLHKKIDVNKNWEALSSRIKKERSKTVALKYLRNAAAILLLPLLILSAVLLKKMNGLEREPAQELSVSATQGTISRITLSDGTEVWLNSGSTLSYPDKFKKGNRMVRLSGEAFFKVSADKKNRFTVVLSDSLSVSAYGTEFNISSYENEHATKVTLISGNLEIKKNNTENYVMEPGQVLLYDKTSNRFTISEANIAVETGWKDGKLVFRRSDMMNVVKRLSRHFNVNIQLEGKELYDYEYSATFTTETLPEILELLAKTAPITYEIIEREQSTDYSFPQKKIILRMK
ncbi:MAG: DUF4974 domain-containing protein [Candidatus Azobacteroides sp.]|nr:DUF4974 domain-containing protein [Candidatus Azobacteroides sp.]